MFVIVTITAAFLAPLLATTTYIFTSIFLMSKQGVSTLFLVFLSLSYGKYKNKNVKKLEIDFLHEKSTFF